MSNSPYISVSVRLDESSIVEARAILRAVPKGWPKAAHRALKRTTDSAATQLSRLMSKRMKAKVGDIKKMIYKHYPSFENLRSTLEVSRMGKQMINLDARQDDRGVSYKPSFGGSRVHIPHAFIATGAERGKQVWLRARYRVGYPKEINWNGRLMEAIYIMKEPGISRFLKKEDFVQIEKDGAVNLKKNIEHEVNYQLQKWKNK